MVAGERSAHDALISGALASRMIRLCRVDQYRLVPSGIGSGNVVLEVRVGPGTLLGPEETDLGRGHYRLVVALMPPRVRGGVV